MEGNITPELCEALSKLTYAEWASVKASVDSKHKHMKDEWFEGHFRSDLGRMVPEADGDEIMEEALRLARL